MGIYAEIGMKLDGTFSREIKKLANGDGSREAKFAFVKLVREANKDLSSTDVRENFSKCLKAHGRVAVGVCVAATVLDRDDRLSHELVWWAREVMRLYTNAPHDKSYAVIRDGLHPTRIEEYSAPLVRATTY